MGYLNMSDEKGWNVKPKQNVFIMTSNISFLGTAGQKEKKR